MAANSCTLEGGANKFFKYILKKCRIRLISSESTLQSLHRTGCTPERPDRRWGSPSLLFSGYRHSLLGVKWRFVAFTAHLSLMLPSAVSGDTCRPTWRGQRQPYLCLDTERRLQQCERYWVKHTLIHSRNYRLSL